MATSFNILITSASKKIPLIKALQHSLKTIKCQGKVIGGDANPRAIFKYFVDEIWEMPKLEALTPETLMAFCKENQIKAIIPTRDGELSFFAQHKAYLHENGISCLVSSPHAIEICRDKKHFSEFLSKHGFPTIPTSENIDEIATSSSYVVKERFGAGAGSIALNVSKAEAKKHATMLIDPIFQPYIKGEEFSVDLYVDKEGAVKGVIARTRDYVVDGESQITTSVQNPALETLCVQAAQKIGIYGHAIFQVLEDHQKKFHLIECNPRFGGASTLSVAMGLKSFEWFFLEALQQPLPWFKRSKQEKQQIRYPKDLIISKRTS